MDSIAASSKRNRVCWVLLANIFLSLTIGCSIPSNGPQKIFTPEFIEQEVYGKIFHATISGTGCEFITDRHTSFRPERSISGLRVHHQITTGQHAMGHM